MVLHGKISNNDFESNTELEVLEDQLSAEFLRRKFLVQDQKLPTPCCAKCYSMNIAFVLKGLWHEVIFRAKSLFDAFSHSQKAPVGLWRSYQTTFISEH